MSLHEKRFIRGVRKGMRHAYPISYKINARIDKLTDPFELKVRELFNIHTYYVC
jgi:hypothetical protein